MRKVAFGMTVLAFCVWNDAFAQSRFAAPEQCEWRATSDANYVPNVYLVCVNESGEYAPIELPIGIDSYDNGFNEHTIEQANAGVPRAITALGDFYTNGPLNLRDLPRGIALYEQAAAAGDARAMTEMSYIHAITLADKRDIAKAKSWRDAAIEAATAQNDAYAMVPIAFMFSRPVPELRDEAESLRWMERAAQLGSADGIFQMASHYEWSTERSPAKAAEWYDKLGASSDAHLIMFAASSFRNGRTVPKDAAKAVAFYRRSFDLGYVNAADSLGGMYDRGDGIAKDQPEAVRWYERAATRGNKHAMVRLAEMYRDGAGVTQDAKQAQAWADKAAARAKELPPPHMVQVLVRPEPVSPTP